MKKNNLMWVLPVVIICAIGMFVLSRKGLQEGKRAFTASSISALDQAFYLELSKGNYKLAGVTSNAGPQWHFLTVKQYDNIIIDLDESYNFDAKPSLSQPLVDFWGNRFEIAYRKLPGSGCDSIVVSKGPDGVYGTRDDIVSGHGASAPAKP